MWKKLGKGLLILNLLALDGYVLYSLFVLPNSKAKAEQDETKIDVLEQVVVPSLDSCGEECKRQIELKLSLLTAITATITPGVTKAPSISNIKSRSVHYVPIPGSGSTLTNDWVSLPSTDFYFSTGDYPGIAEAYFEVNMKLKNGNGSAFVRLFDSTHAIAVEGSEVKTESQTSVAVLSGKIKLWAGYNLYKIQAKSLTADTTIYEGGRLKIITEN